MPFEITGKVALITGGASGIGLCYAKELLRSGLRGVTLADISTEHGSKALQELRQEFGPNKAIYVKTDVTNKENFEEAFKKTIDTFKNLDILINNAGILNDAIWEREIAINLNGVIHGILLGLEHYIPRYKTSDKGVIVNMSSIAGLAPLTCNPIYTGTKFGIVGMTKAFGDEPHYNRTRVKVLAICPGATETALLADMPKRNLGEAYQKVFEDIIDSFPTQKPESVATALVKIIQNAKSGTVWAVESGQDPYEFIMPPRENFAPK